MKRWAQALALAAALHGVALLAFFLATRGTGAAPVEPSAPRAATAQRVTRVTLNGRPQVAPGVEPVALEKPGPQLARGVEPVAGKTESQVAPDIEPDSSAKTAPQVAPGIEPDPSAKTAPQVAPGVEPVVAGKSESQVAVGVAPSAPGETGSQVAPAAPGVPVDALAAPGAQGATPGSAPVRAGSGVDVDGLVHARLSAAAGKCYPAAAKRFRQRGVVEVSFCSDAGGSAVERAVKQSSGFELLDRAAVDCVLANASPLPAEATGRCFALPVRFGPQ